MSKFVSDIRKAGKSGNYVYAILEALTLSRATVVITGSNQRMTNLEVMSSDLIIGEQVVVDYSSGVPPFVRGHGTKKTFKQDTLIVGYDAIVQEIVQEDIAASILSDSNQIVGKDSSNLITFNTTAFDIGSLFDEPYGFIVLSEGAYYVTIQLLLDGISCDYDHRNRIWAALDGDTYGIFAINMEHQNENEDSHQITLGVSGVINASIGEKITCRVWLDPAFGQNSVDLIAEGTGDSYAAVSPCFQIFKIGSGFYASRVGSIYSQEFSGLEDPARIELEASTGLMYVGEDDDYVRAIASSKQQADLNLTCDFQWQSPVDGQSYLSFFLKTSVDWYSDISPTACYEMRISNKGSWSLWRYNAGTPTLLDSYNVSATTLWQKLEFEINGDVISAKTWINGESEPGFQIEHIDDAPLGGTGGFQVCHWNESGSRWARIDNVNLTTP